MSKFPITVILCSKNESHLLEPCFRSIEWCEQIIFLDQKSEDNSIAIAKKYTADIHSIEPVKAIEIVRWKYVAIAKHEWVLFMDPDERIPKILSDQIKDLITKVQDQSIATIKLPYHYYVGDRKLIGTMWGNQNIVRIIHRNRVSLNTNIHKSIKPKNNYSSITLKSNKQQAVEHLWVKNISHLRSKHSIYLRSEGESMYRQGYRYKKSSQLSNTLKGFLSSLFRRRGYKDGILGLNLSLIYAQYVWDKWEMLKIYQKINVSQ